MKKRIAQYFKNILGTIVFLLLIGVITLVSLNGSIEYGDNPLKLNLDREGPYAFFKNDSLIEVNYLKGNRSDGFYLKKQDHHINGNIPMSCFFPLDSSSFEFTLNSQIHSPKSSYSDGEPILAISDIESGFKAFRDFLISNEVINERLEWIFGKGHLVLVGDFMDRGFSTQQVLWFIYKLEQEATLLGGHVHFILGNHELYNLQGKFKSAAYKYPGVASILGKQQHELYNQQSFLGKWLASKNTIEIINGILFTHGGIHPDIANYNVDIDQVNRIVRKNYRKVYFPKPEESLEQLVTSNRIGFCWYRGYFKDDLTQEEVEIGLNKFKANAVVVGHTIQRKVKKFYNGMVIGIDVKHPKDYNKNWPNKQSEGLFISKNKFYRVLNDGEKIDL